MQTPSLPESVGILPVSRFLQNKHIFVCVCVSIWNVHMYIPSYIRTYIHAHIRTQRGRKTQIAELRISLILEILKKYLFQMQFPTLQKTKSLSPKSLRILLGFNSFASCGSELLFPTLLLYRTSHSPMRISSAVWEPRN